MLENYIEISISFLAFLAVKSTDATRGGLPSDDNDAALVPTTVESVGRIDTTAGTGTLTIHEAHSAASISCWDGLSTTDREFCELSEMSTPSCEHSQICKRIEDTCGYACENPSDPKPSDVDGQIGEFKVL